jgi:hypothetical protein
MVMEMFVNRILNILLNKNTLIHTTKEIAEAQNMARRAIATYEAVVTGNIL